MTFAGSGVVHAADKALDALRRMRAGMRADKRTKTPIKEEVSTLFHRPRKVIKLAKNQHGSINKRTYLWPIQRDLDIEPVEGGLK